MPTVFGLSVGRPSRAIVFSEVRGLPELLRKLHGDPVHARPWRRALYDVLAQGKRLAQSRAPGGPEGGIAKRTRYRIHKAAVPLYGTITNAASHKGYRYGFALNAGNAQRHTFERQRVAVQSRSRKTGKVYTRHVNKRVVVSSGRRYTYHYAGGTRRTGGWFDGVKPLLEPYFKARMNQLVSEIEGEWKR